MDVKFVWVVMTQDLEDEFEVESTVIPPVVWGIFESCEAAQKRQMSAYFLGTVPKFSR